MKALRAVSKATFSGLLLVAAVAAAAAHPKLEAAYERLVARKYQAAETLVLAYLADHPNRYDADFILARSQCSTRNGSPAAVKQAKALKANYVLDETAGKQVQRMIERCVPKQPPQRDPETGNIIQMLETPDNFDSAKPSDTVARILPRMTTFVERTSFTGGDFAARLTSTREDCARICQLMEKCRAVTYARSDRMCSLKSSVPPGQPGSDFSSARKVMPRPPIDYVRPQG